MLLEVIGEGLGSCSFPDEGICVVGRASLYFAGIWGKWVPMEGVARLRCSPMAALVLGMSALHVCQILGVGHLVDFPELPRYEVAEDHHSASG